MQASALTLDRHGTAIVAVQDRAHSVDSSYAGRCSDSSASFNAEANGCGAMTSETHRCPSNGLCCDDAVSCHAFCVDEARLVIGQPIQFAALDNPVATIVVPFPPALSARLERPPRAG
jgi:hypothetical protein